MNIDNIQNTISAHKSAFSKLGIKRIGVFGSAARGELKKTSDIDIILDFTKGQKSYRNYLTSSLLLEKILQRTVDTLTPEAINPLIKPYIEKDLTYVQIS